MADSKERGDLPSGMLPPPHLPWRPRKAGEKCVFAKRTQLENRILAMPDGAEPHLYVYKNEPKRTQIGYLRTQNGAKMRKNWSDGVVEYWGNRKGDTLNPETGPSWQAVNWDTGLEKPVDPQAGKPALHGRGLGGSGVDFESVSAAAHRAALRGSRILLREIRHGGRARWELVGKGWEISRHRWERIFDFIGEIEGGWEFPAFSRGEKASWE
jgi:hypothetical protein